MSTITADPTLLLVLGQVKDVTEIRDSNGNLMGIYTPKDLAEQQLRYEKAKQLFDPKEHERRLREESGKGVPLEEIWRRLEGH